MDHLWLCQRLGLPLKEAAKGAGVGGEEEFMLSHAWGQVANIGCRTHGGQSEYGGVLVNEHGSVLKLRVGKGG